MVREESLSNLVLDFMREHLAGQKLVINREVEILPIRLAGGRADILVQAAPPHSTAAAPRGTAPKPLTVVIEVKGCWNVEIKGGIDKQLLRYLQPNPEWVGIFLVGYFHCPPDYEHDKYKSRHKTEKTHTPEQILADLQQEIAKAGASPDIVMHARVLRSPLILGDETAPENEAVTNAVQA